MKKNIDLNKVFLAIILTIIIIFIVSLIPKKGVSYPKIKISRVSVESNVDGGLVNELLYTNDNIWYYDTFLVEVCDNKLNCYDLLNALNHKQITIEELIKYYESLNKEDPSEAGMVTLNDGGTTIYTLKTHTVIFCNTLNNNKDIYFGPIDMTSKLNSEYCNHNIENRKYFTRTYKVLNILDNKDPAIKDIMISLFQGESQIVSIPSKYDIEENKTYEFTFYTYQKIDDSIDSIFANATLSNVKETDKVGLEQLQEPIIITTN